MNIDGVAPPGWQKSVERMKDHKDISNPFALAWFMKKHGAKPHRHDTDADAAFDMAMLAALTQIHAYGMPALCTQAATGDVAACVQLLDIRTQWVEARHV